MFFLFIFQKQFLKKLVTPIKEWYKIKLEMTIYVHKTIAVNIILSNIKKIVLLNL